MDRNASAVGCGPICAGLQHLVHCAVSEVMKPQKPDAGKKGHGVHLMCIAYHCMRMCSACKVLLQHFRATPHDLSLSQDPAHLGIIGVWREESKQ